MGTYLPGTETLDWEACCGSGTPHSQDIPPKVLSITHGCGTSLFWVCAPPTSLDGHGFFHSVVIRLPFNLISDLWWLLYNLVVFWCGCVRKWAMFTYATTLTGSLHPEVFLDWLSNFLNIARAKQITLENRIQLWTTTLPPPLWVALDHHHDVLYPLCSCLSPNTEPPLPFHTGRLPFIL